MIQLAFDIETNGLYWETDTLHCLVIKNITTGESWSIWPPGVEYNGETCPLTFSDGLQILMGADLVIGHNIIDYDIPVLKKLYPWFEIDPDQVYDTLVASQLIYTNLGDIDMPRWVTDQKRWKRAKARLGKDVEYQGFPGGSIGNHGLEHWGYRLGVAKGDYSKAMKARGLDPWASWNPEMQSYCEQDVEVTDALYRHVQREQYPATAMRLDHRFTHLMTRQRIHGFVLDARAAEELSLELLAEKAAVIDRLKEAFPDWTEDETWTPKRDNKTRGLKKGVPVVKVKNISFEPGSRWKVAHALITKYRWKPKEWVKSARKKPIRWLTDHKGNRIPQDPQINEDVLSALPYPEAPDLARFYLIQKRLGQLSVGNQSLLKNYNAETGRVHGRVVATGTVTGRCSHSHPNISQVPKPASAYGDRMRALLGPPDGMIQIGADAEGLEMRWLAHYLNKFDGGAFQRELLDGDKKLGTDPHTQNQIALGLRDRDHAKEMIYAYMYGAQAPRLGFIFDSTVSKRAQRDKGVELEALLGNRMPALVKLREDVIRCAEKRGFLIGVDKRRLHVRSPHTALNTLLQSAGGLMCKQAALILDETMVEAGYVWGRDWAMLAHVHDEVQIAVRPEIADHAETLAADCFRLAGEYFNSTCPHAGEAKRGTNWAETH